MGFKTFMVLLGLLIIGGVSYVWLDVIQRLNTGDLHAVATTSPKTVPTSTSTTSSNPVPAQASTTAPLSMQVVVATPLLNATTSQTFEVKGSAPGQWFNEATFPIQVRDSGGIIIGTSHGKAQGTWMTTNLVPFSASVSVAKSFHGAAKIILLRDNPSGLPENDDSVTIPIAVE